MTSISEGYSLIDLKQKSDLELLEEVVKLDLHQFSRPWKREDWSKALTDSTKAFYALVDRDGDLLGFSLWQLSSSDELAHLLKIHIEQARRRKGYGSMLLTKSEESLKSEGYKKFYLEVEKDNISAIQLYQLLNYAVVHSKKDYYDDGKDALFMIKDS